MVDRRRLRLSLIYAAIALVLPVGMRLSGRLLDRWPCPFRSLTGLPCAACGSGRALEALGRLQLRQALAWNPGVVLGLLALLLWPGGEIVRLLWSRRTGRDAPDLPAPWLRWGLVLGLAANWFYLLAAGLT